MRKLQFLGDDETHIRQTDIRCRIFLKDFSLSFFLSNCQEGKEISFTVAIIAQRMTYCLILSSRRKFHRGCGRPK